MSDAYEILVQEVGGRLIAMTKKFVSEDAWNLIPDEGKQDVIEAGQLMVECELAAMAGRDVSVPVAALAAALGNWELAGRIKVDQHADEFLDELKDGLIIAAKIIFSTAIAGLL